MTIHRLPIGLFVLIAFALICAGSALAQEAKEAPEPSEAKAAEQKPATKALQFAVIKSFQLHKPEVSIKGFRWNLIYGVNKNVAGLDIGIGNIVNGEFKGIQAGLYNAVQEKSTGFQIGLLNTAKEKHGAQLGIFNNASTMNGLQIGLFYNTTDKLNGIQIGLINFVWERKPVFCLPIINGSF